MNNKSLRFPEDYKFLFWNTGVDVREQLSAIYYPNMCHVCNCIEMDSIKLIRCGRCFMISYCGEKHQNQHWEYHRDLCEAISNLLETFNVTNLFDFLQTTNDPTVRLTMKENLIKVVEKKLHRNLDFAEKLMFLQPRICVVCSESNPKALLNCKFCPQASFCERHQNDSGHASVCHYYRLCFLFDNYKLIANNLNVAPRIREVPFVLKEDEKILENMEKLLECHMEEVPPILDSFNKIELWEMLCSEFYSFPLTLMHILEKLNYKHDSELIVHIIGAYEAVEATFGSLEVLLHFIPQLTTLKVMMIGKELSEKMKASVNICSTCKAKNKTFEIEVIKIPYAHYVDSKSFVSPKIAIAHDIEGEKFDMWTESVLKMMKVQAPFVATTRTELKTKIEKAKMTQLLGSLTSPVFTEKNPFAGIKPTRSFGEDGLSFSNNYITVYSLYDTVMEGLSEHNILDSIQEGLRANNEHQSLVRRQKEAQKSSESPENSRQVGNLQNPSTSAEKSQDFTEGSSEKSKKKKKKRKETDANPDENIKKGKKDKEIKSDEEDEDEEKLVKLPLEIKKKQSKTYTLDPSNPKNKPELYAPGTRRKEPMEKKGKNIKRTDEPEEEEESPHSYNAQQTEALNRKIEALKAENESLARELEELSMTYIETRSTGKIVVENILTDLCLLSGCILNLQGKVRKFSLSD